MVKAWRTELEPPSVSDMLYGHDTHNALGRGIVRQRPHPMPPNYCGVFRSGLSRGYGLNVHAGGIVIFDNSEVVGIDDAYDGGREVGELDSVDSFGEALHSGSEVLLPLRTVRGVDGRTGEEGIVELSDELADCPLHRLLSRDEGDAGGFSGSSRGGHGRRGNMRETRSGVAKRGVYMATVCESRMC